MAASSFTLFDWMPCFDFLGITYLPLVVGSLAAIEVIGEDTTDCATIGCCGASLLDTSWL